MSRDVIESNQYEGHEDKRFEQFLFISETLLV